MNKFYNFITNEDNVEELYLYGAIVSDKWSDDDVTFNDFKDKVDELADNSTLNIYINSPGGEVFVTDSIISMLMRAKEQKNITINCYIDGLGASCASWLPMCADNIYIYPQSILMIHKPMSMVRGNANEMAKEIEVLNKIEDSMIKMYITKAKEGVTEDQLKDMLSNETWLTADEIQEYFNVELIESEKQIVACIDEDIMKNYKKVPEDLIKDLADENEDNEEEKVEEVTKEEMKEAKTEENEPENAENIEENAEKQPENEENNEEIEEKQPKTEENEQKGEETEEINNNKEIEDMKAKLDLMKKKLALYMELN